MHSSPPRSSALERGSFDDEVSFDSAGSGDLYCGSRCYEIPEAAQGVFNVMMTRRWLLDYTHRDMMAAGYRLQHLRATGV
eukprot:8146543-Pyramimonas_sp.AAC.1